MSEPQPEPKENLQDFLGELDTPIYQTVEKGDDQVKTETRDLNK